MGILEFGHPEILLRIYRKIAYTRVVNYSYHPERPTIKCSQIVDLYIKIEFIAYRTNLG